MSQLFAMANLLCAFDASAEISAAVVPKDGRGQLKRIATVKVFDDGTFTLAALKTTHEFQAKDIIELPDDVSDDCKSLTLQLASGIHVTITTGKTGVLKQFHEALAKIGGHHSESDSCDLPDTSMETTGTSSSYASPQKASGEEVSLDLMITETNSMITETNSMITETTGTGSSYASPQKASGEEVSLDSMITETSNVHMDEESVAPPVKKIALAEAELANNEGEGFANGYHGPGDEKLDKDYPSAENVSPNSVSDRDQQTSKDDLAAKRTLADFGYKFNEAGKFVSVDDDNVKFEFNVQPDNRSYNQKRYEAIGEIVNEEIYRLLETRCGLKRVSVPIDAEDDEPTSFIFVSDDVETNAKRLLLLIHGSGVVRAGQWARRLLINDGLETGSQIPYIEHALKNGFAVVVLNTNLNSVVDQSGYRVRIRGSETSDKHGIYCWKHLISKYPASDIAIVAHSAGGYVTTSMAAANEDDFMQRVFAVAFTDSWYGGASLSQELHEHFQNVLINWRCSDQPLNARLNRPTRSSVEERSAGTSNHESSSAAAFDAVWAFFHRQWRLVQKASRKRQLSDDLQNGDAKEPNVSEDCPNANHDPEKSRDSSDDVILVVDNNRRIYANQALLSINSPVFKRLLSSSSSEAGAEINKDENTAAGENIKELPLEHGAYEDIKSMLSILKFEPRAANELITDGNVERLLELAKAYEIQLVKTRCEGYILRTWKFDEEKIVDAVRLAAKFDLNVALSDLLVKPTVQHPSILTAANMQPMLAVAKEYQLGVILDECEKEMLEGWAKDPEKVILAMEHCAKFEFSNALTSLLNQVREDRTIFTDENIERLLALSERFSLADLKSACGRFILTAWPQQGDRALRALEIAHKMNFPELVKRFVPLAACLPLAQIDAFQPRLSPEIYAAILRGHVSQLEQPISERPVSKQEPIEQGHVIQADPREPIGEGRVLQLEPIGEGHVTQAAPPEATEDLSADYRCVMCGGYRITPKATLVEEKVCQPCVCDDKLT